MAKFGTRSGSEALGNINWGKPVRKKTSHFFQWLSIPSQPLCPHPPPLTFPPTTCAWDSNWKSTPTRPSNRPRNSFAEQWKRRRRKICGSGWRRDGRKGCQRDLIVMLVDRRLVREAAKHAVVEIWKKWFTVSFWMFFILDF